MSLHVSWRVRRSKTSKNGTGLMLVADPLRVINLVPDFSVDDLLEHPLLMCLEFFNKFLQEA